MIKLLNTKIRKSKQQGIFHDSRKDIDSLAKICNELINKVNELTEEVNKLSNKQNK